MTFIAAVLAVARAIPVVNQWLELLVAEFVKSRINEMREENRNAIRKAFETNDQRPIEKVIGSPNEGKPSGVPGSEFRDSVPGFKSVPKPD